MNEQNDTGDLRDGIDVALAAEAAEEQGLLFTDDVSPLPSDLGYRGPTACNAAGITYRQLDYWARTGLIEPTVRGGDEERQLEQEICVFARSDRRDGFEGSDQGGSLQAR